MSKAALIDPNGLVVQIEKTVDAFEVAPPFAWVECEEDVVVGMYYVDGEFVGEETDADQPQ